MDPTVAYPLLFVAGSGVNVASLAANYTVDTAVADTTSPIFHSLTATGSNRQFILPDPSASLIGLAYVLSNAGTSGGYSWLVRGKTLTTTGTLSSATTIGTAAPGDSCYMICYFDGTYYRWKYQAIGATIATSLGTLTEGLTFAVGITKLLDASATATGEALIKIGDNLAIALEVKEGSNSYLKFITTNSAEAVALGQPLQALSATFTGAVTTTDGVAAGIARKVGGGIYALTTPGTLGPTGGTAEVALGTITLPASTIKAGTIVKIKAQIRATAETGATTLTLRGRLGGVSGSIFVATGAFDLGSTDVVVLEAMLTGRVAPGASVAVAGGGQFSGKMAGAVTSATTVGTAMTGMATNGALDLVVTGQFSASDANAIALEQMFVEIIG